MVRMGSPGPIPVNGSIRNTAEAYFDATSATYTRAWTAVTTRVGQYRATRHERPTPTSSLYMSDTDKSYISSKRILHQLHRRLARTSPNPHQASTAALAITDEASPFALRSTRKLFRGEQCTRGAFARANEGEEGAVGVVADIAKLSVGREEYYTRELATDHEQYLSGHGESPGRWYGAGASGL